MPIQTTYSRARANLAKLCDEVAENQRIVIISRRGRHDLALISADELSGLLETAHLLRSPKKCGASTDSAQQSKDQETKSEERHRAAQGTWAWAVKIKKALKPKPSAQQSSTQSLSPTCGIG